MGRKNECKEKMSNLCEKKYEAQATTSKTSQIPRYTFPIIITHTYPPKPAPPPQPPSQPSPFPLPPPGAHKSHNPPARSPVPSALQTVPQTSTINCHLTSPTPPYRIHDSINAAEEPKFRESDPCQHVETLSHQTWCGHDFAIEDPSVPATRR